MKPEGKEAEAVFASVGCSAYLGAVRVYVGRREPSGVRMRDAVTHG